MKLTLEIEREQLNLISRLDAYKVASGKTYRAIFDEIGVSRSYLTAWRDGTQTMHNATAKMIQAYLEGKG
jgi:transcriptional regulator with XRE-family HTH domain